ncbi:MAG: SMC-Scp complex subunit ScpB, partial [Megasphaera micronuciformis]|nr:SMC-Scp complex subunit ScpB [Megasphaera micronuciformis]
MSVAALNKHTGWSNDRIETAAEVLEERLAATAGALVLLRVGGGYQLATRKDLYEV